MTAGAVILALVVLCVMLIAVIALLRERLTASDAENVDLRRKMAVLSNHPSTTGRGQR